MKTKCLQMQKEILASDGFFTAAIEEHCADCDNCHQVKLDWKMLSTVTAVPDIPLTNDFAIIRAAQKHSRNQRLQVAIRRGFGYAAATVSGIAAVYAVMFHMALANTSNDAFKKAWNWDSFEEKIFVLDVATEISRQDITIGNTPKDDTLDNFIETEINIELI